MQLFIYLPDDPAPDYVDVEGIERLCEDQATQSKGNLVYVSHSDWPHTAHVIPLDEVYLVPDDSMATWTKTIVQVHSAPEDLSIEYGISNLLSALRHLCDAEGLDFGKLDKEAYDQYMYELGIKAMRWNGETTNG